MVQTVSADGEDAAADGISKMFVAGIECWITCSHHHGMHSVHSYTADCERPRFNDVHSTV